MQSIEISKEPVRVVEEEVTQPEREAAEDPAPQDEEGDGSEPGAEIRLRRSARTRRPPKRFADYQLYQICDRRREELSILKQILENTNRSEERNILLGCISDIISKLQIYCFYDHSYFSSQLEMTWTSFHNWGEFVIV